MCLEGESPGGMGENGLHTGVHVGGALVGVGHEAGLEEAVGGLDMCVGVEILVEVHHFEFIAASEHAGMNVAAAESGFGRKRDPIEAVRQGACAVGFDSDSFAGGVFQALHEVGIDKKRGFAAGEHHPWCFGVTVHRFGNFFERKHGAGSVERVAEAALKVAPGKTDKHRWYARVKTFALKGIEYFVDTVAHSGLDAHIGRHGVVDVGSHIVDRFLHVGAITFGNAIHNPARHIFGGGIERQHLVDVFVVEFVGDKGFNFGEIVNHTVGVQIFSLAVDNDVPIVAVQVFALALIVEMELVASGNFYCFFYVEHIFMRS